MHNNVVLIKNKCYLQEDNIVADDFQKELDNCNIGVLMEFQVINIDFKNKDWQTDLTIQLKQYENISKIVSLLFSSYLDLKILEILSVPDRNNFITSGSVNSLETYAPVYKGTKLINRFIYDNDWAENITVVSNMTNISIDDYYCYYTDYLGHMTESNPYFEFWSIATLSECGDWSIYNGPMTIDDFEYLQNGAQIILGDSALVSLGTITDEKNFRFFYNLETDWMRIEKDEKIVASFRTTDLVLLAAGWVSSEKEFNGEIFFNLARNMGAKLNFLFIFSEI